ncbi:MAG: arsenosugar biosynthesis radical SAM (seleno)protein ArsS, partial [Thermodesulfobacteriota bacterium]
MVLNNFEKRITEITGGGLYSRQIEILQVNLGLRCNQQCHHCHLEASPQRKEVMAWPTMQLILRATKSTSCQFVDLTGGAPELNPHFR